MLSLLGHNQCNGIALIHNVKLDIRKLRYKGHGRYLEKAMHSYANIHVYERNGD